MLVLTRKVGDVIAIGDNIKIVVMAIKGKQVRLGVQADRNTIVHREEIYQKIQQETQAAAVSDASSAKAARDLLRDAKRQESLAAPTSENVAEAPSSEAKSKRSSSGFIVRKASASEAPRAEPTSGEPGKRHNPSSS